MGQEKRVLKQVSFQKILKAADNKKSEIKNKPLKSILFLSRHQNKNKVVVFATIVDQRVFCSKKEPSCPFPSKTISRCTTNNEKNKNIENLIFANLRWYFGSKQVKGKHTNRITGKVKTKTIYMSIQKLVKSPTITSNSYNGME